MNLQNKLSELKIKRINSRYKRIACRLQDEITKRKIRVIFINCESSKWAYQHIYERFKADKRFEVKVVISVYDMLKNKKYDYLDVEKNMIDNYNFFKSVGIKAEFAYDARRRKYVDLKYFSPDIVFYDEPQSISKIQSPEKVSKYALTMYCSYGSCISNGDNEHEETYRKLFVYFVDNAFTKKNLKKFGFCDENVFVAGQPKIDAYLDKINKKNILWKTKKKHIIIAPHFSFDERTELRFGTFNWNYKFFLDYAKNHSEYEFILKPHPSLKREIVRRKLMTLEEMNEYFAAWEKLDNASVYDSGNYIDMFRTSDVLITDSNSFLFEYLPTEKPVIHLLNPKSKGHNEFGKKIIAGYYKAKTTGDIEKYLEKILVKNDDDMLSKRKDIIKNVLKLPEGGVNSVVYNYTIEAIMGKKQ